LFQMLRNCTAARYAVNRERMLRLSRYSHECLVALRQETGIHYEERRSGVLELFRSARELDEAGRDARLLEHWGIECHILDRTACAAREPALRTAQEKFLGGLYFPGDESGDCFQFTQALAQRAEAHGVRFMLPARVERLEANGTRLTRVITDKEELSADAYVLACGSYSPLLLRPLGVRLPVYPVKGYSATIDLADADAAPTGSITDATYKVVITRLGNKLRGRHRGSRPSPT
jgi:D-amino-acid dehydrogenase